MEGVNALEHVTQYIPAERQKKIVEHVETNTSATIHDLSELFQVSEATIRRDLDDLHKQGALMRTHGGAIRRERSTSYESLYSEKIHFMEAEKKRIAQYAATLVQNNNTILLDSGTTTYYLAQALSQHDNLNIITNDLFIACEVPLQPTSTLIVTGGIRRKGRQELVGTAAENFIRDTHVDTAFVGTDGVTAKGFVTNANFSEIGVKKMMLESSNRKILLADHTKFGNNALARFCYIWDFDMVITDKEIEKEQLDSFKNYKTEFILV